jgi:hypothetical protein
MSVSMHSCRLHRDGEAVRLLFVWGTKNGWLPSTVLPHNRAPPAAGSGLPRSRPRDPVGLFVGPVAVTRGDASRTRGWRGAAQAMPATEQVASFEAVILGLRSTQGDYPQIPSIRAASSSTAVLATVVCWV